jgi:ClpP class serine protease
MIMTEKAYAMNLNELEGFLALDEKLSAADINQSNSTSKSLVQNGQTAVISINGALFPKPNIFTLLGFGTSLSSIQDQLHEAEKSPSIKKIILNFDSSGGSVTGINELANSIKSIQKSTTAYVTGSAASAAFWLASACDEIVCDATAMVGSIGIVGIFKKNSQDKIEIVSSNAIDKRPDVGTDEGKAVLLKTIDDLESVFISSITQLRPKLSEDKIKALRGGVLIGAKAVNDGFADGIGSLQGLIEGKAIERNPSVSSNAQTVSSNHGWSAAIASVNQGMPQAVNTERNRQIKANAPLMDKKPVSKSVSAQTSASGDGWNKAFSQAR